MLMLVILPFASVPIDWVIFPLAPNASDGKPTASSNKSIPTDVHLCMKKAGRLLD